MTKMTKRPTTEAPGEVTTIPVEDLRAGHRFQYAADKWVVVHRVSDAGAAVMVDYHAYIGIATTWVDRTATVQVVV